MPNRAFARFSTSDKPCSVADILEQGRASHSAAGPSRLRRSTKSAFPFPDCTSLPFHCSRLLSGLTVDYLVFLSPSSHPSQSDRVATESVMGVLKRINRLYETAVPRSYCHSSGSSFHSAEPNHIFPEPPKIGGRSVWLSEQILLGFRPR